jgi:rfaE bifunctional protein nucleotidyltransferase chain/domain
METINKVIFTNGCFDIIHIGHIRLLEFAKTLGSKLVVGLNSDASIKRLKGLERPINNQADRAVLLSAIKYVDEVIIFEEDTPYNLITLIKPDIIVKGGDYTSDKVIGNNLADVVIFKYIAGYSTTNIIRKTRAE